MDRKASLGYFVCGFIILGVWIVCFLPTLFYMNPVKLPDNARQGLPRNLSLPVPIPSFPCNPPLIYSNKSGFCKPPCDWIPFTDKEQDAMAITDWITAIFCCSSFALILVTWTKIPEFMKFPHFIVLLMAGTGALVEILVIIPKFGPRSTFFCSSEFLDEALDKPTEFCQAQGILVFYISLVTGEMFAAYNTMLLKNLVIDKLPNLEQNKRLLIILSLLAILLPIIPVVYVSKSDRSYVPVHLRFCFPGDTDLAFFLCILPQQIFLCFGITCLTIVIFKLIKERKSSLIGSPSQARTRQQKLQRITIHFIMVIISYIVCVYLTYGLICIQLNNNQAYEKTLTQYFRCLIFSADCPKDFLKYETSFGVLILSYLAGNVFQAGTLVLLAGKPKARNLWRSWLPCLALKRRETPKNTLRIQVSKIPLESEPKEANTSSSM